MDGGAWPFLVGGVICLVNSDNERDSPLLTSRLDLEMRVRSCRDYSLRGSARVLRAVVLCLSRPAVCVRDVALRVGSFLPALQVRRPFKVLKNSS